MTKDQTMSQAEISDWLLDWMAAELAMPKTEIRTDRSLLDYSLSSVTATILVGDLEDWLNLHLPPTLVWDYPSIDAMSAHLAEEALARSAGEDAAPAGTANPASRAEAALADLEGMSEAEIDALLAELDEV